MTQTIKRQWDLSRNWLEIDLDAAWHNARTLRQSLPHGTEMMAVVKDNAYGHGAFPLAVAFLEGGATQLAVSTLEEGIELRESGIEAPILILSPVDKRQFRKLLFFKLTPTLVELSQARSFSALASARGVTLPFHLKVDVGMSRYGLKVHDENAPEKAVTILRLKGLNCRGVFTHLPCADDPAADAVTRQQLAAFTAFCHKVRSRGLAIPRRHAANSAALLRFPEYAFDLVRPGLALYGIPPANCAMPAGGLRPVMNWKAEVMQSSRIPAHAGVSYNHRWVSKKDTIYAVLGVGYGDGYSRSWSPGAYVTPEVGAPSDSSSSEKKDSAKQAGAGGASAKVIGSICMDAVMVEVPNSERAEELYRPGRIVNLLGGEAGAMSAAELAAIEGTIPYEVLTRINARVSRVYFSRGKPFIRIPSRFTFQGEIRGET